MSILTPEEPKTSVHGEPEASTERVETRSTISNSLKIAIGSSFILRLAGSSTGFLLGAYLKQIVQADANLIGALAAIYYATELLLAPVFGALSDLRGRKFFLVLGPVAGALAVQIHPLTIIPLIIGAGRLLEGIATAANAPGTLGFLADATSGQGQANKAMRGRVMGLYEISFVIGLVSGNLLGGWLWEFVGSNGFRLVSVVYLLAAAILFLFIQESLPAAAREHHDKIHQSSKQADHPIRSVLVSRLKSYGVLLKEPALRSFVPAWLAINAVLGLWLIHVQPLMLQPKDPDAPRPFQNQLLDGNLAASQVGIALGAFGVAFMLGIYVWSHLYARMRRTDMMLAAIVGLFILTLSLAGINNHILPGPWGQWPLVPFLAIGVLLESGFTPVALAYLADISESRVEHRGAVMGLYSVFLGIGQFVGGSTGGLFIVGLGFNGLLFATVLLGTIAGGAVLFLRLRHGV